MKIYPFTTFFKLNDKKLYLSDLALQYRADPVAQYTVRGAIYRRLTDSKRRGLGPLFNML